MMKKMFLRYISGYICRKVQNKFASTRALQNKEEMLLFMSELVTNGMKRGVLKNGSIQLIVVDYGMSKMILTNFFI